MRYLEKLNEGVALDSTPPSLTGLLSVLSHCLPSLYRRATFNVADRYCYQLRKNAFAQPFTLYPCISRFTNWRRPGVSAVRHLVDHRPSPEDECHKARATARLIESAARLSPILRRTFQLRYMDHLSVCETARVLGVPIGIVKRRLLGHELDC